MDYAVDLAFGSRCVVRGVDEDGIVTSADVEIVDSDGRRWAATVMTHSEIVRLMEVWQSSGECQSGAFFRVPDLIVVRDPSREGVSRVFSELHRTGNHRYEMTLLDDA